MVSAREHTRRAIEHGYHPMDICNLCRKKHGIYACNDGHPSPWCAVGDLVEELIGSTSLTTNSSRDKGRHGQDQV